MQEQGPEQYTQFPMMEILSTKSSQIFDLRHCAHDPCPRPMLSMNAAPAAPPCERILPVAERSATFVLLKLMGPPGGPTVQAATPRGPRHLASLRPTHKFAPPGGPWPATYVFCCKVHERPSCHSGKGSRALKLVHQVCYQHC